jgi:hypothetical protein
MINYCLNRGNLKDEVIYVLSDLTYRLAKSAGTLALEMDMTHRIVTFMVLCYLM